MNLDNHLLETVLNKLPEELHGSIAVTRDKSKSKDACLKLNLSERTARFYLECKTIHRKESLSHFSTQIETSQRILICNGLTTFLREYCHQNHINYIDEAGNARIVGQGIYILIQGNKTKPAQSKTPMMSVGIMKCLFAMLVDETLITQSYQEIAKKSDISLGMVSKAINYLIDNNHIPKGKDSRRLLDKSALIYQWLTAYNVTLRPKTQMMRLNTPQPWEELPLEPNELWGGEVAASKLTNYLTPEHVLLYTRLPLQQKIRQYRAKPDERGNLTVAAPFWGESLKITPFALALLSTAELLTSHDSRNQEVAEIINDQYLHLKQLPQSRF
ncbi:type IV toxin-antitoxin system AbiEi family antitoxin [Vibrio sp. M260118]|uniref:type IV toxin-antitoxin system AbiEi family antitoxin n=1 Tax=Vibrio sp. M260118 TaxID=3020896 RepID=UPI002F3F3153